MLISSGVGNESNNITRSKRFKEMNIKDTKTFKSPISKGSSQAYFMDALRLSHMLRARAIQDIEAKARDIGASDKAILKLKEDVSNLAEATPLERFLVPKACMQISAYLVDGLVKFKKDPNHKYTNDIEIPGATVAGSVFSSTKSKRINKFDITASESILSSEPMVVFGTREELDLIIPHIIDRAAVAVTNCLHFSIKTYYKKLNKHYARYTPDKWEDTLRTKDGFNSIIVNESRYRPVELVIVDDINHGFNPAPIKRKKCIARIGRMKEALLCLKRCKAHTSSKGICSIICFHTDDIVGGINPEMIKEFEAISSIYDCSSDKNKVHLTKRKGKTILSLRKDKK